MFKNYMQTALRNLLRHKVFALINIGGLAIGLAVCIMIFLFVRDELNFDTMWGAPEQIVRFETAFGQGDESGKDWNALMPGRLKTEIEKQFTNDIQAIARLFYDDYLIDYNGNAHRELFSFVDSGFFDIFNIPMISGDAQQIFVDNQSVIISEHIARKYFGDADPVGQTFALSGEDYAFKIVGVMANLPDNTHLDVDILGLFDEERYRDRPWVARQWLSTNVYMYARLRTPDQITAIEAALPDFLDRVVERSTLPGLVGKPSERMAIDLVPVTDIHLFSRSRFHVKPPSDFRLVYSYGLIAVLILFIASINFVNLSTAKAGLRAREIAIRKSLGAARRQLVEQFLGETAIVVMFALVLALAIVELTLPAFNSFITKLLFLDLATDSSMQIMLISLFLLVVISTGAHPALKLAAVQPAKILRGTDRAGPTGGRLRAFLVVFQFTISIGLIAITMIIYNQIEYARTLDMGFETDNIVQIKNLEQSGVTDSADAFRDRVASIPGVQDVAFVGRALPLRGYWDAPIKIEGRTDDRAYDIEGVPVGANFMNLHKLRVVAGRGFSKDITTDLLRTPEGDEGPVLFNAVLTRAAVKHLEFESPEAAVSQIIRYKGYNGRQTEMTIIGVVDNVLMRSLRDPVEALYFVQADFPAMLNIRFDPLQLPAFLTELDQVWRAFSANIPMQRVFIDQQFNNQYQADQHRGEIFAYFTLFAVFVSCLGLYGLMSFSVEQKTREISIRKVFGASSIELIRHFLWQFSKPILIALTIAWPIAWIYADHWLSDFEFRISLTLIPFILSGMIAILISWVTVGFHAVRVARSNPVNALRYE